MNRFLVSIVDCPDGGMGEVVFSQIFLAVDGAGAIRMAGAEARKKAIDIFRFKNSCVEFKYQIYVIDLDV
jgi:hypothetical protein